LCKLVKELQEFETCNHDLFSYQKYSYSSPATGRAMLRDAAAIAELDAKLTRECAQAGAGSTRPLG